MASAVDRRRTISPARVNKSITSFLSLEVTSKSHFFGFFLFLFSLEISEFDEEGDRGVTNYIDKLGPLVNIFP
jgi:hypothetical protein